MTKHSSSNSDSVSQVSQTETNIILDLLRKTLNQNIEGDIVEFGCYRGDTSVLLQREIRPPKTLWLYDSFAGLPPKTKEDNSAAGDQFRSGELFVTKREVLDKFKRLNLTLPKIKKAFFEELDKNQDLPSKICFAFLDGDLYSSIRTSLHLIESKLQKGSIVVVHDYNNPELPGSARAVDEWIKNHSYQIKQFKTQETLAIIHCI